jgi:ATP-dependent Lon protease
MHIEVLSYDGTGRIELTGSLGEVMKESSHNALSYVKSKADELGIDHELFKNKDIHINFPEGAVPKDGPSAGVATAIAITSELTNIPVRRDVAVTGEITLRGRVLPIGGLREKTMAAYLAGVKTIIIPSDNIIDEKDIMDEVKEHVEIKYVSKVEEALAIALTENPFGRHKNDETGLNQLTAHQESSSVSKFVN